MLRFDVVSRVPSRLSLSDLSRTAERLTRALRLKRPSVVSVNFVSESAMKVVNKRERQQNHPTDVLSFASAEEVRRLTPKGTEVDLGELIVCPAYATKEARRRSIDAREELIRLLVHGVLHLQGYDHAHSADEARMFGLQERIVEDLVSTG